MVWEGSVFRRRECLAANATFHGCGKRSHWQHVCCSSSANNVAASIEDETNGSQLTCLVIHEVLHVNSARKEIFVELGLSPTTTRSNHRMLSFQVDSGCSSNTIHVIDLQQLPQATIEPSAVHPLDYSKTIISFTPLWWIGKDSLGIVHDVTYCYNLGKKCVPPY